VCGDASRDGALRDLRLRAPIAAPVESIGFLIEPDDTNDRDADSRIAHLESTSASLDRALPLPSLA